MEPESLGDADIPPLPDATGARIAGVKWATIGELILCSGFPTQFALGALLQAAGIAPLTPAGQLSDTFIFSLSLLDAGLLLSLITFFLWRRGERVSTVVLGNRPVAQEVAFGVLSAPMVAAIVIAVSLLIRLIAPGLRNLPINPLEALLETPAGLVMFLLVVIVAGGIREEVQRAFLLHRFRQDLGGVYRGLLITSLAFGLGHTLQGWDATLITAVLGATWGLMYISRGSAVAGIVSHSLFNCGELLRAFLMR
ncbi:MAG: type II CAAX endopeptidase family protein [Vicinamibacterales bacterium]